MVGKLSVQLFQHFESVCMYLSTLWLKLFHLCCQHLACTNAYFDFDEVMSQIKAMTEDVQPLLNEVRDSGLLKEVENLTRSLTLASEDLRWNLPNTFCYVTSLPLPFSGPQSRQIFNTHHLFYLRKQCRMFIDVSHFSF